jgi:hypothetical protein
VNPVVRGAVAVTATVLGCLSVLGVGAGTARPAAAVTVVESGWWWRLQDGTLPTPPVADAGSLWIAADPTGPLAMAAMRFEMAEGEAAPIVTLELSRHTNPTAVSLLACPVTETWEPVDGGAWSARPKYDCTNGSVAGAFSLDDTRVQFDLSSIATTRVVDVAIFTGTAPPAVTLPALPVPVPGLPVTTPPTPNAPGVVDVVAGKPTAESIDVLPLPLQPEVPAAEPAFEPEAPFEFAEDFVTDVVELPAPAVPAPRAGAPVTPVYVVPGASNRGLAPLTVDDGATRAIAGAVFALLAIWWWRLASGAPITGRPRLALGDDPALLPAPAPLREGRPIPLR